MAVSRPTASPRWRRHGKAAGCNGLGPLVPPRLLTCAVTPAASVRLAPTGAGPVVAPFGLSRLSCPRIVGAIGDDRPACFSASPTRSSGSLLTSCSSRTRFDAQLLAEVLVSATSSACSSAESASPPGTLVTACCSRATVWGGETHPALHRLVGRR